MLIQLTWKGDRDGVIVMGDSLYDVEQAFKKRCPHLEDVEADGPYSGQIGNPPSNNKGMKRKAPARRVMSRKKGK